MAVWNYPDLIFIKLKSGNIWKTSVINFLVLNIIYFLHNVVENQGPEIFKDTISDQLSLLIYYFLTILLISGLFKVIKIQYSISLFAQYLLATSIIFGIIYIVDIPVLIFSYEFDIYFSIVEFIFYLWISWILIKDVSSRKKKYLALVAMTCIFYLTTVLHAVLLISLNLWKTIV